MPIGYNPANFWSVCLTRAGSKIPHIMWRVLVCMPSTVCAFLTEQYSPYMQDVNIRDFGDTLLPLSGVVSLLLAFRINDAFGKWNHAAHLISNLQSNARLAVSLLLAYTPSPPDEKLMTDLIRIRRHIVLAGVLMHKHVHGEKDLTEELKWAVITPEEVKLISKNQTSISRSDGKKDKFPSKNRPGLVFQWIHCSTMQLFREGKIPSPPHHMAIDSAVRDMSEIFEEVEHLGATVMPLPYAQIVRLVVLIFILAVPWALARELDVYVLPVGFITAVVFFTIDECASEMETPFGDDINDVDLDKILRRIDKHTSAQMGSHFGTLDENYDIYPETASANKQVHDTLYAAVAHDRAKCAERALMNELHSDKAKELMSGTASKMSNAAKRSILDRPSLEHGIGTAVLEAARSQSLCSLQSSFVLQHGESPCDSPNLSSPSSPVAEAPAQRGLFGRARMRQRCKGSAQLSSGRKFSPHLATDAAAAPGATPCACLTAEMQAAAGTAAGAFRDATDAVIVGAEEAAKGVAEAASAGAGVARDATRRRKTSLSRQGTVNLVGGLQHLAEHVQHATGVPHIPGSEIQDRNVGNASNAQFGFQDDD